MTKEETVAYIISQAACAIIEMTAMESENASMRLCGLPRPYKEREIRGLIDKYGISHNAVITMIQDAYR